MLSDVTIAMKSVKGGLISPYHSEQQQPCSYDLTLDKVVKKMVVSDFDQYPVKGYITAYDKKLHDLKYVEIDIEKDWNGIYRMHPGDFIIASTKETVKLPNDIAGRFEGKSSLGRIGLTTHVTAGFIDAGFEGQITLEMKNENRYPIDIKYGMRIGQICFFGLDSYCAHPYGDPSLNSHYQGQKGPTTARG